MITDDLLQKIRNLKTRSINTVLMFLKVYNEGCVQEKELCEIYACKEKDIRKTIGLLIENDYINSLEHNGLVVYVLNRTLYNDFMEECFQCEKMKRKKINVSDKTFSIFDCGVDYCKNYKFLKNFNCIKEVNKIGKKVESFDYHTVKAKVVDNYSVKNFVDLFYSLYVKKFSAPYPKKSIISDMFYDVYPCFRIKAGKSVFRKKLYEYTITSFKKIKNGTGFSFVIFSDEENIEAFLNKGKTTEKGVNHFCKKHKINCSYCRDNVCALQSDGLNCNNKIRLAMRKKYNAN